MGLFGGPKHQDHDGSGNDQKIRGCNDITQQTAHQKIFPPIGSKDFERLIAGQWYPDKVDKVVACKGHGKGERTGQHYDL